MGTNLPEATIKATTQRFVRASMSPIDRKYRMKNISLKYNAISDLRKYVLKDLNQKLVHLYKSSYKMWRYLGIFTPTLPRK